MEKRHVDVVVISDLHLGTYGCHAKEIVNYLQSISPNLLILNGDIVDGWQFNKRYFPTAHLEVITEISPMFSAKIWLEIVVPIFAPITIPMAWRKVIACTFTKAISIIITAEEESNSMVTMSRLRISVKRLL